MARDMTVATDGASCSSACAPANAASGNAANIAAADAADQLRTTMPRNLMRPPADCATTERWSVGRLQSRGDRRYALWLCPPRSFVLQPFLDECRNARDGNRDRLAVASRLILHAAVFQAAVANCDPVRDAD